MTKEQLKEYLGKLVNLEVKKYELETIHKTLMKRYEQLKEGCKPIMYAEYNDKTDYMDILGSGCWGGVIGAVLAFIIRTIADLGGIKCRTLFDILVTPIVIGFLLGFICAMFIAVLDESNHKDYIKKQNKEIKEKNNKNLEMAQRAKRQCNIVKWEIDQNWENLEAIKETLSLLYCEDIIYNKYWDLVPVASFYEYICAGRCTQLEGHEGAYNIYENELMGKIIIGKLDIIITQLEEIRSSQYLLYDAIQKSNQMINRISSAMDCAIRRVDTIADNSEIIKYNSSIAAENTSVLRWMEECEYLWQ